jgi:hypothetical protein
MAPPYSADNKKVAYDSERAQALQFFVDCRQKHKSGSGLHDEAQAASGWARGMTIDGTFRVGALQASRASSGRDGAPRQRGGQALELCELWVNHHHQAQGENWRRRRNFWPT